MWRAYGGRHGVALVLKGERIVSEGTYALGARSSPVEYLDADGFRRSLGEVADGIRQHVDHIRARLPKAACGTSSSGCCMRPCSICAHGMRVVRTARGWRRWHCHVGEGVA